MSTGVKIHFRCPNCDRHLMAKPHRAGRTYDCPYCNHEVTVPPPSPEIVADLRRRQRRARRSRKRKREEALAASAPATGGAPDEASEIENVALEQVSSGEPRPIPENSAAPTTELAGEVSTGEEAVAEPSPVDQPDIEPAPTTGDVVGPARRSRSMPAPTDESPLEIVPTPGAMSDSVAERILDRLAQVERNVDQARFYGLLAAFGVAAVGFVGILLWIILCAAVIAANFMPAA